MVDPSRIEEVLQQLSPVAQDLVLIGGQAVHYWTSHYMRRVDELRREAPYTTKDLDFCGTVDQARACAKVLGAACREFTPDDRSPCAAIIKVGDLQIDFLRVPHGIYDATLLRQQSIAYEYGRVMHPLHLLVSRVANVAELPNYQTERGLKQLRGAILCVRELIVDTLDKVEQDARAIRSALQMSERVFKLAESDIGVRTQVEHGLDVLDAVVLDDRLPDAFRTHRFPQAQARIEAKRLQLRRSIDKAAELAGAREAIAKEPQEQRARRGRKR